MKYAVLMGDLVKSRSYKEDIIFAQSLMKESLDYLNKKFKKEIQAEAKISEGDGMQVLFKNAAAAFSYYRLLELFLYPLSLRASIGIGEVYRGQSRDTNELYGTAYFNAREALELCEKSGKALLIYDENGDNLLLNAMLSNREIFSKRGNPFMTNGVQIAAEIISPLVLDDGCDAGYDTKSIFRILGKKEKFITRTSERKELADGISFYSVYSGKRKLFYDFNFDFLEKYLPKIEPCYVEEAAKEDKILLSGCWKRGANVKIAEIMGISRQIVDRAMKYVSFPEKRNFDGAVLMALDKKYGR